MIGCVKNASLLRKLKSKSKVGKVFGCEEKSLFSMPMCLHADHFATFYFKGVDIEGKRTNKQSTSMQSSGKRHAENLDAAPAAKRQVIETSLGSPKPLSPSKTAALSRDSSFKSLDKGKVRPVSFGNNSSNDVVENVRSPGGMLPQTTKGMWLFCWLNLYSSVSVIPSLFIFSHYMYKSQQCSFCSDLLGVI